MQDRLRELELRVERAERRCRLLTVAGALALVGGFTLALARPGESQSTSAPGVVRAPFTVKDRRGRPIFVVSDSLGFRGVSVHDVTGEDVGSLGVMGVSGGVARGLEVNASDGERIAHLGDRPTEIGLTISDEAGNTAVRAIHHKDDQDREVAVFNADGNLVGELESVSETKDGLVKTKNHAGQQTFLAP